MKLKLDIHLPQLDRIEGMLTIMSEQENALDTAVASLAGVVDQINANVQAVLAKLADVTSVDLTDETAALTDLTASLQSASDELKAATEPTA